MKISVIIADAASLCGDSALTAHDVTWYEARVNDFFDAVAPAFPETRLQSDGTLGAAPSGLTSASDWPWDNAYDCACRFFVAWKFYAADSEDTRDQAQADRYRKLYERELGMKPTG